MDSGTSKGQHDQSVHRRSSPDQQKVAETDGTTLHTRGPAGGVTVNSGAAGDQRHAGEDPTKSPTRIEKNLILQFVM